MARKRGSRMPSSGAGIANYSSDYKSKITVKPSFVIVLSLIILIIMVILHSAA